MKRIKKYWKLAVPFLAVVGIVAVAAAVIRGVNFRAFRVAEGNEQWDSETETTMYLIWQELKKLFDFNTFK